MNGNVSTAKHDREHATLDTKFCWQPTTDADAWAAEPPQDRPLTLEEVRRREHWQHVDSVWDMVPFWRRGIEAAERGEALRMEDFLESVNQNPWDNTSKEWGYAYSQNGWGSRRPDSGGSWRIGSDNSWGKAFATSMPAQGTASGSHGRLAGQKGHGNKRKAGKRKTGRSVHGDTYAFVETVARYQAADPERKRRMHVFFEVCNVVE